MARDEYLFTSESVTEGHPDKIADQISDAVLDAILAQDPTGRVACETLLTTGLVVVAGEITTTCYVDIPQRRPRDDQGRRLHARQVRLRLRDLRRDRRHRRAVAATSRMGVDKVGAGDQGLMFGYACNETEELMPLPIMLAHRLVPAPHPGAPKSGQLAYLRPDGKSQVTVRYVDGKPVRWRRSSSPPSTPRTSACEQIREDIIEQVILPIDPAST